MVTGEIKRRLRNFEDAKKHFEALKKLKEFQGNHFEKIIDFQLRLIGEKDCAPHSLADVEKVK